MDLYLMRHGEALSKAEAQVHTDAPPSELFMVLHHIMAIARHPGGSWGWKRCARSRFV